MKGYDDHTYGASFADVYDDWYADVSDVAATVHTLVELAGRGDSIETVGPVLELGVGTGRLSIPLAAAGVEVHGIDASPEMLAVLQAKPGAEGVTVTLGDMVDDLPDGPFGLVFVAYNTLFNLTSPERQQALMAAVAARLLPGGCLVVEAFVPEDPAPAGSSVSVRSMAADHVVLRVEQHEPAEQRAEGHFVELTEAGGVRLRPWSIRWARPEQLDQMAAQAGLQLTHRWGSFSQEPFTEDSDRHVSLYHLAGHAAVGLTPATPSEAVS